MPDDVTEGVAEHSSRRQPSFNGFSIFEHGGACKEREVWK